MQIMGVAVEGGNGGTPPGQLDAVEAGIATDVQGCPPGQVGREESGDFLPFVRGEIAEGMIGGGL
jgi:hypothetical protein